jgi:monofunctional glycosyltransferase
MNMDFFKLKRIKWKHIILFILLLLVILIFIQYLTLPDVAYLQKENPKTTALIEKRNKEYIKKGEKPKEYRIWVPYSRVSDYLKKAILVGEDINFFSHRGIDYEEIKESIKIDWEKKKFARGASTITQQLARNLFLSTSKNPLRKIKEILIAFRLEKALSKTRIFELYLNLVEWGDGIYGCEAASRVYFGKSCSDLTPNEAIRMSTSLPFPRKYPPISTAKRFERRRRIIYNRMLKYGFIPKEEEKVSEMDSIGVKMSVDTAQIDSTL